jgi:23S rRNA (pseudouridine1915-N3)-methyltransferase
MKLHIAAVGRPRAPWAGTAVEHYQRFLKKYGGVEFHFVPAVRLTGKSRTTDVPVRETARLLEALPARATRIFLAPGGRQFDSEKWAAHLDRLRQKSPGPLAWLVGGPLGLDLRQKRSTDRCWSLSPLTFPHELALVILCEQLARGLSILHGDSYHQ